MKRLRILTRALCLILAWEIHAAPTGPSADGNSGKGRPEKLQNLGAARVERDVIYGQAGNEVLAMDLYFPSDAPEKNFPAVMYVHGGGWVMGDKSMVELVPGPGELLRRGYVVATINYRLGDQYKFPAMIEDAKCAVRFLRAHAKTFGLDEKRLGVMGDSAGGQLVCLLGLTGEDFEGTGGWSNYSSRVQAVVDLYGPTDFTDPSEHRSFMERRILRAAFGTTAQDAPVLQQASPLRHVSSNAPPFLIVHGDRDRMVRPKQSQNLHAALQAAGVSSTLLMVTNYSHGFAPWPLKPRPDAETLSKVIADFFDQHLKPAGTPP